MNCTQSAAFAAKVPGRAASEGMTASCSGSIEAANKELSAFTFAVCSLYGTVAGDRAADHWLQAFKDLDESPLPTNESGWRRITINAASRLAQDSCMYRHYEVLRKEGDDRA